MLYDFEGFRLDTDRRLLHSKGLGVPLSSKALDTLIYLVEHPGQLIEKSALIEAIWPRVVVEENSLDRNISVLRKTLGETPGDNRFIATVPGRGYRFVAHVVARPASSSRGETRAEEAQAQYPVQPAKGASAEAAEDGAVSALRWKPAAAAISVALVIATLFLWFLTRESPRRPATPASFPVEGAAASADSTAAATSVAVMPFANLTGDPEKDYFGDGMAEELIYCLTRSSGLQVPARTSSFAYKGRNVDVRQIGRDLRVSHLLEGSVRSAGDTVHVTVQLVDTRTGFHIWSQSYQREFRDVFKLQNELANAIAQTLSPGMHAGATTDPNAEPPTKNVGAYRLFLQANALVGATEGNLRRALSLYDQALELDPHFARALTARATTRLSYLSFGLPLDNAVIEAERDAMRAVALDPDLAGAQMTLAEVHTARGRWLQAASAYRAALSEGEHDSAILISHSRLLASVGHMRESVRAAERAHELAPLALPAIMIRASTYSFMGRDEEALRDVNLGMRMGAATRYGSVPIILSSAAWRAGRYGEAAEHLLEGMPETARGTGAESAIALAFEASMNPDKRAAASRALNELTSRVPLDALERRHGTLTMTLYALAGDLDGSYAAANRAVDEYAKLGSVGIGWIGLWTQAMHSFRQDPRFNAFVGRLKMMDYWKVYGPPDDCTLADGAILCR